MKCNGAEFTVLDLPALLDVAENSWRVKRVEDNFHGGEFQFTNDDEEKKNWDAHYSCAGE